MFKDFLLPYLSESSFQGPLQACEQLATHFKAHLQVGLPVYTPAVVTQDLGGLGYPVYLPAIEEAQREAEALATQLRARLTRLAIPAEVFLYDAFTINPANTLAMRARYAGLTVMASDVDSKNQGAIRETFNDLLHQSGRPVLMVPPGIQPNMPAKFVVIAWTPTREATRALHDAMPLLQLAQRVDVLMIDPQSSTHGGEPGADIATHLARHGLNVQVMVRASQGKSVASALLQYAETQGADLMIAGGYGHSRFREFVLGGVTRELISTSKIPILFSH